MMNGVKVNNTALYISEYMTGHVNEIWSAEWTLSLLLRSNHICKSLRFCKSRVWSVCILLSELCKLVRVRRIWGVYDVCEGSSCGNSGVWWMTLYPHTLHWVVNELQAPIVVLEVYVISGHMHYIGYPCPTRESCRFI